MEGAVARWYNRLMRTESGEFKALADRLASSLPLGGTSVLEVAPGPGLLAIELARRGLKVCAVDISETFLGIAKANAAAHGVDVNFQWGNAAVLPVESSSIDLVVCRAAFKSFAEPVKALTEMRRVLRPQGTAVLIDMRRDVSPDELNDFVDAFDTTAVNRWLMMLVFRTILKRRAYSLEDVRRMLRKAHWREPRIETSQIGFECWLRV